jgi:hypothetical protein
VNSTGPNSMGSCKPWMTVTTLLKYTAAAGAAGEAEAQWRPKLDSEPWCEAGASGPYPGTFVGADFDCAAAVRAVLRALSAPPAPVSRRAHLSTAPISPHPPPPPSPTPRAPPLLCDLSPPAPASLPLLLLPPAPLSPRPPSPPALLSPPPLSPRLPPPAPTSTRLPSTLPLPGPLPPSGEENEVCALIFRLGCPAAQECNHGRAGGL